MKHEFETRLLPRLLAATRRGFAFYVTDPVSSVHECILDDAKHMPANDAN
jgi:hypothetical protein